MSQDKLPVMFVILFCVRRFDFARKQEIYLVTLKGKNLKWEVCFKSGCGYKFCDATVFFSLRICRIYRILFVTPFSESERKLTSFILDFCYLLFSCFANKTNIGNMKNNVYLYKSKRRGFCFILILVVQSDN